MAVAVIGSGSARQRREKRRATVDSESAQGFASHCFGVQSSPKPPGTLQEGNLALQERKKAQGRRELRRHPTVVAALEVAEQP